MVDFGLARFRDKQGLEAATGFLRRGSGASLVLIHGVGVRARIWAPQIDFLSVHFDVVAYDLLGHGESSPPPPSASLGDYSEQLLALLDGLGIRRAHFVGHSMGALVALDFALAHPNRVSSVVALNAVFCRTPEQRAAVDARAAALDEHRQPLTWESTIARWFGDIVPQAWAAAAATVRGYLAEVDPLGYARTYRVFATSDAAHRDRLGALVPPALFMTGEHDPNSTPAMSEAMAHLAPQGRALIIKAARHMMSLTDAAEINSALFAFLGDIAPGEKPEWAPGAGVPREFDRSGFRKALGTFVTGVTIVATLQDGDQPRGFTANSFTSVSLDPPLILVCISKAASTCEVFSASSHFSISILTEAQSDLSSLFASKASDKFGAVGWRRGPAGSPLIDGAAAWFDCRRRDVIGAGDHIIVIGEVMAFGHTTAKPLGYYRGAHVNLGLSLAALSASRSRTEVGAILEHDGALILIPAADGMLDLPVGTVLGTAADPASLAGRMQHLGIDAELNFLFAVFENPLDGTGCLSIYYRGILERLPAVDRHIYLAPFDAIPWSKVRGDAVRSMIRRFVRERSEDAFGIYVGDSEHGTVQALARPGEPNGMGQSS